MSPVSTIKILFAKLWQSFSFNALFISVQQENTCKMELTCVTAVTHQESQPTDRQTDRQTNRQTDRQTDRRTQLYVLTNTHVLLCDDAIHVYQCATNYLSY
jgi:hypothetical protein